MTSLRDIKAKYADGTRLRDGRRARRPEAEPVRRGADEAERTTSDDSQPDEDKQEEKPKPASSGEAHQPRTDAEIGEGGSLFDL